MEKEGIDFEAISNDDQLVDGEGEGEEEDFEQIDTEIARLEENLENLQGGKTLQIDEEFLKNKEERLEDAKKFRAKQMKKGVVYLPSIPPYMNPNTLRRLLDKYSVERIYLSPEAEHKRRIRIKNGGNRKIKYTEGWVEFSEKKTAKQVAQALNGNLIGGKKRHNLFHDDTWLMKYLSKFKWENLKEKFAYDRKVREERLKVNLSQAKREQNFYIEKAEMSKKLKHIQDRKKKREIKEQDKADEGDQGDMKEFMSSVEKKRLKNVEKTIRYQQKHQRMYKQKEPKIKHE